MNTMEKAEVTILIHQIARFLKSGIPIYNSGVPYTARSETRTQSIANPFAFHVNARNSILK